MRRILAFALLLLAFPVRAEVFPDQPYYGMRIDYSLEGIVATGFEDRETPRIVTRLLEGLLTGDKVRISGEAHSLEEAAELIVTISAGSDMKRDSFQIKPGKTGKAFSFEIDVPKKARGSHISVLLNPLAKERNLVKALRLDVTAVPKR